MTKKSDLFYLPNDENIDEIIGEPPHWLMRWGVLFFIIFFAIIISLCYVIKYPETKVFSFKIANKRAIHNISSPLTGKISSLKAKKSLYVSMGDTLFKIREIDTFLNSMIFNFISPYEGEIMFDDSIKDNQMVKSGQKLFSITSAKDSLVAIVLVSKQEATSFEKNQKVILNYINNSNGLKETTTSSVDMLERNQKDSLVQVVVKLPRSNSQNKEKENAFYSGMIGNATFVTYNKNILTRIFELWRK